MGIAAVLIGIAVFRWLSLVQIGVVAAISGVLFVLLGVSTLTLWIDREIPRLRRRLFEEDLTRVALTPLFVIATLLAVLAVSLWQTAAGVHQTPALPQDTSVPLPVTGAFYALGDSYAAGEGQSPYLPGTGDSETRCHRSAKGYSQLLQIRDPQSGVLSNPTWQFVACSGAMSLELTQFAQHPGVPPQVRVFSPSQPAQLVTVTIGGNDLHWPEVLRSCVFHPNCMHEQLAFAIGSEESGTPSPRTLQLFDWATQTIKVIEGRLTAVFQAIRAAAGPDARVLVVGYPDILPTDSGDAHVALCGPLLHTFGTGFRQDVRTLQGSLNRAIQSAARDQVEFVDPNFAWDGHEVCGRKGGWLNPPYPAGQGLQVGPGTFHPNTTGQIELARIVACYLKAYPHAPGVGVSHPTGLPSASPYVGAIDHPLHCGA